MMLEEVIAKARREWQSAHNEVLAKAGHAPDNRIQPSDDVIANAVRAFLGSELSQASAMQIGPSNEGHRIAIYFDDHKVAGKAFAALSSIGGE